ncbi:MAG TPA: pitrilysin family protein, partial [Anaeromyxobacteraceae bacterium]|nr:pitrilysin family protein [Anaeromyxobacteraceae bacterium]
CAGASSPSVRPEPGGPAGAAESRDQAQAAPQGPDRAEVPTPGPAPELRLPEQRHFTLANGMRVRLVVYDRLPIVALNLVVNAGAMHDPPGRPGLASFTAGMLTEGTQTRSAFRISEEIAAIGGSLGAGAGFDSASLTGASLSRHLPKLLELFADVAMAPAFPKSDFARVLDVRLVALLQQRDQPGAVAGKAFANEFWGPHPYGHWVMGTEASLQGMRPADLARFHARYWVPANAELVVVGDVAEGELRAALERTLGRWKKGAPAPVTADRPPAAPKKVVLIEKEDAPQAYVLLGMPGLQRSSPDYVPAAVAFHILGGGSSSRLFRTLREEKGYTYGIYASGEARKLAGASVIAGNVKAEVTGAALRDLLAEVEKVRTTPPTPAELEDAKNALVLGLPAGFATAGGIAGHLAELVVHGLPDDYWNRFADEVRKVTADDVVRVAQRYLDPARLTTVMVAEPDVVKAQLADLPLGPVEVRPSPAAAPARAPRAAPEVGAAGVR